MAAAPSGGSGGLLCCGCGAAPVHGRADTATDWLMASRHLWYISWVRTNRAAQSYFVHCCCGSAPVHGRADTATDWLMAFRHLQQPAS